MTARDTNATQDAINMYAAKWAAENDRTEDPTDEALFRTLSGCVRPPRPAEYPAIRREINNWRWARP